MASPCSGGEAVPGAERVHGRTLPGNAKAAVIISDDGGNWTPWTTFTSGAYRGRC